MKSISQPERDRPGEARKSRYTTLGERLRRILSKRYWEREGYLLRLAEAQKTLSYQLGKVALPTSKGVIKMAKYKEWLEPEKLELLEKMGRDRATDIMIAGEIGINVTTLWRWENQYPEIAQALERGREVTDYIVENALFRKAIDGDVKAQIFWLRNRCPEKWGNRRKPEEDPEKPGLVEAICQAWERHEHTE